MSNSTEPMSDTGAKQAASGSSSGLKTGQHFKCHKCGMALQITVDCGCNDPSKVRLQCCGQDLQKG